MVDFYWVNIQTQYIVLNTIFDTIYCACQMSYRYICYNIYITESGYFIEIGRYREKIIGILDLPSTTGHCIERLFRNCWHSLPKIQ